MLDFQKSSYAVFWKQKKTVACLQHLRIFLYHNINIAFEKLVLQLRRQIIEFIWKIEMNDDKNYYGYMKCRKESFLTAV